MHSDLSLLEGIAVLASQKQKLLLEVSWFEKTGVDIHAFFWLIKREKEERYLNYIWPTQNDYVYLLSILILLDKSFEKVK